MLIRGKVLDILDMEELAVLKEVLEKMGDQERLADCLSALEEAA